MRNLIFIFVILFYHLGISQNQFIEKIQPSEIKKHIDFLASDTCAGRNTGTPGQKVAANYIRKQFEVAELTTLPGQADSLNFFQPFNIYGRFNANVIIEYNAETFTNPSAALKPEGSNKIQLFHKEKKVLRNGTYFLYYGSDAVHEFTPYKVHYIKQPNTYLETNIDSNTAVFFRAEDLQQAFKNIETIKSINEISTFFVCFPNDFFSTLRSGYITDMLLQQPDSTLSTFGFGPTQVNLNNTLAAINEYLNEHPQLKIIACNSRVAERFFNTKRENLNQLPDIAKTEVQIKVNYQSDLKYIPTENVLAYVEGTTHKDEVIVVGAHYDHVGVNAHGICRGADDNASGTAALIEIAKTFADAARQGVRPKRSVLFIAFSGEEMGLYGSLYYVSNPWFPLDKTKFMINMDMIGRCNKKMNPCNYTYIIAGGKEKRQLKKAARRENRKNKVLRIDWHPGLIGRLAFTFGSDHFNFRRKGISNMVFTTGFQHPDYHTTRDIPEKINFQTTAQIAKLVFLTIWRLANE